MLKKFIDGYQKSNKKSGGKSPAIKSNKKREMKNSEVQKVEEVKEPTTKTTKAKKVVKKSVKKEVKTEKSNLDVYEKLRVVPDQAKKPILGGRLKGFTDINPMWRIKALTEQFGMVGFGWYYDITSSEIIDGAGGERIAVVGINLFVKQDGEWSKPIRGCGGSMFVSNEKYGAHTSDECFKMALTDAISVSCKSLGMGADVYFEKDRTKYTHIEPVVNPTIQKPKLAVKQPTNSVKEQKEAGQGAQLRKVSDKAFYKMTMKIENGDINEHDFRKGLSGAGIIITPEQEIMIEEAVGACNVLGNNNLNK